MPKKRNPEGRSNPNQRGRKAFSGPDSGGEHREKSAGRVNLSAVSSAADVFDSSRFDELTKQELYERARRANIEGRSGMTREQLLNALRRG